MALPSTGTLKISDINLELGRASNAANSNLKTLASLARAGSTPNVPYPGGPFKISHWYGYSNRIMAPYINAAGIANTMTSNNLNFASARTATLTGYWTNTSSVYLKANCNYANSTFGYYVDRTMWGVDLSSIAGQAVSATLQISVGSNNATASQQYVLVKPSVARAYNYSWTSANFPECINTGATLLSSPITITAGQTGTFTFTLNAAGISYINSTSDGNFAIVQYNNDWLNTTSGILTLSSGECGISGTVGNLTWA